MSDADIKTTWVQCTPAKNPNLPANTTRIPLHHITLWPVGTIPNALVFPSELDEKRLHTSISKLSSIWPNLCGRYENDPVAKEGTWPEYNFSINLTSSPIPFETQTLKQDRAFATSAVVQPSLDPFVPQLPPNFFESNSGAYLFAVRHTVLLPSRQSVLGVNVSHVLVDGAGCNLLLKHLGQLYTQSSAEEGEDLESIPIEMDLPSFFPHINLGARYPPSKEIKRQWEISYFRPLPSGEAADGYAAAAQAFETVQAVLHRADLRKLQDACNKLSTEFLSEQDVLSAWWVVLLQRIGQDIRSISYSLNYRSLHPNHAAFPPNLPTLSANVAQMVTFPLPDSRALLSSQDPAPLEVVVLYAQAIRAGILKLRSSPTETLDWLSVAAFNLYEAASQGLAQCMVPPKYDSFVNSNIKYDWQPYFGSSLASYHTPFSLMNFLRVFLANAGQDGSASLVPPKERDVEITFNVEKGTKERAEDLIRLDSRQWSAFS